CEGSFWFVHCVATTGAPPSPFSRTGWAELWRSGGGGRALAERCALCGPSDRDGECDAPGHEERDSGRFHQGWRGVRDGEVRGDGDEAQYRDVPGKGGGSELGEEQGGGSDEVAAEEQDDLESSDREGREGLEG